METVTAPRPIETLPAPVPGDPQAIGIALHAAEATGAVLHAAGVAEVTGVVLHAAGVVEAVGVVLHVQEDDKTKTS